MQERSEINHSITTDNLSRLRSGYRIPFGDHTFLYKTHLIHRGVGLPLMWGDGLPFRHTGLLLKGNYSLCRWKRIQNKELVIVRSGFNLGDRKLIITNTPQGTEAEYLKEIGFSQSFSKKALAPLNNGFRESMIGDLVSLARLLGLDEVIGTSASCHEKVVEGYITEDFGKKRMDEPFMKNGFILDEETGKYVYNLTSTSV